MSSVVNLDNTNTDLSLAILPPQAAAGTIPKQRRTPSYRSLVMTMRTLMTLCI